MRKILATTECFINKDGKYLMLHRSLDREIMPGVWMAPGGKREKGEGLFEAARREVLEETGAKIKNLRVRAVGVAVLHDLELELFFEMVLADYASGEVKYDCVEGDLQWLTPKEILAQKTILAELSQVLLDILDESKPIISYKAEYLQGNKMMAFCKEEA